MPSTRPRLHFPTPRRPRSWSPETYKVAAVMLHLLTTSVVSAHHSPSGHSGAERTLEYVRNAQAGMGEAARRVAVCAGRRREGVHEGHDWDSGRRGAQETHHCSPNEGLRGKRACPTVIPVQWH